MEKATSIPDQVFSQANRFAHHRKMTRSALFTIAVDEIFQHHKQEDFTKRLNEVYTKEYSSLDPVLDQLQALSLPLENGR